MLEKDLEIYDIWEVLILNYYIMSMSTNVRGYVSPENEKYKKQSFKSYDGPCITIACCEAGVSELPKETAEYFGSKYPDLY